MPYCFMSFIPSGDDRRPKPDCPDGVAFLLLADLPGLEWGIFDVDETGEGSPETPVSEELSSLIESAKRYPPALGLAREEMEQVFGDHRPNQSEFANAYATALRAHLSRQHEAPYVMAKVLREEKGYLNEGEWYWLLEISGSPAVATWVSADFQLCDSDMSAFDLTGEQLKRLGYTV
jgi:hypothetical protein